MRRYLVATVVPALILAGLVAGALAGTTASSADATSGTGGYPWASAPCQGQTWTGTMSNGMQGTTCENDDWVYDGSIYNSQTSYGFRNCTDYVAWKVKQTEGVTVPVRMGNASQWGTYFEHHGTQPASAPKVGAIAWEANGDHVAYVESVDANGYVTISEYNEHYRQGDDTWGEGIYDERTVRSSDFEYFVLGTPSSNQSTTTAPKAPTKSPTPVAGPFAPKYTWSWSTVADGGYKFSGRLSIGTPEHVTKAPALKGFGSSARAVTSALKSACGGFNAQTDAIIPTAITMRNNTGGFSSDVYMVIFADNPSSIQIAGAYKSGVVCHVIATANNAYFDGGEGWNTEFPNVAPNSSGGTGYAYLVLPHFFSPDSPDGNSYTLDHTVLALASSFYLKDGQKIVHFTGPGYDQGDGKRVGLMPLNGQMVPCQGISC